ncbi:Putative uncharacterized protein [Moritella viscosa]|uniref:Uncharacterized protein n=1 Tax=Moritella viscosa TaxID=80854 RepID=A0ABY1HCJ0_9GAMM|nr:Putative uncharacterized protein [Moritella viscosa]SGZ01425.1 Putative uncharacterized protein [Moritella viscosa]SHO26256.1 Putative uncharacterized protein [Moritella viscosa]
MIKNKALYLYHFSARLENVAIFTACQNILTDIKQQQS